ncbi:MAG: ATP-dependent zinc metalloprotease FtsH [Bdellovibrionota bacterium]
MSKTPQKQNQQMRFIVLFAGIFMLFLLMQMVVTPPENVKEVSFSEFMSATDLPENDENQIVEVRVENLGERGVNLIGVRKDQSTVKAYGLYDADLRKRFESKGIKVTYNPPEEPSLWKSLLINSLPMIILLVLFFFFMRQLQIGGGKAMSFGKSRAKLQSDSKPKVTFKDIAGIDEAKAELDEIIDFLKDPKKYTKLGARIPKGVLLIGSPGTGKTILARGVAGEANVPFFSISGSDFVEMFVGVGASRVRDLFDQAKKNAPCIIFIDEIDAVGRQRGAGLGGGHDEREQTLNQLLVEMDGFEGNDGVIVIAASNRADVLDPALLRPGRFDRRVVVPKPDIKGRKGILQVHSRNTPLDESVDLTTIAQGTPGFSGADLENLVNEASLIAARSNSDIITMANFEAAKDKVMMGPERRNMIMSEEEKKNTAYHESGHAIIGLLVPGVDPVHKGTILPRGQALGVTIMLPDADRLTLTREYAEGMIAYAMGGRAAEEVVFNQRTTGASNDIEKATDIATKMVCSWGMSEKLGPLALSQQDGDVFLGRDIHKSQKHSNEVSALIDQEIHRIVTEQYDRVLKILNENRKALDMMAEALLIKETIDASELQKIMNGEDIITAEDKEKYKKRVEANANWDKQNQGQSKNENSEEEKNKSDEDTPNLNPVPQGI